MPPIGQAQPETREKGSLSVYTTQVSLLDLRTGQRRLESEAGGASGECPAHLFRVTTPGMEAIRRQYSQSGWFTTPTVLAKTTKADVLLQDGLHDDYI